MQITARTITSDSCPDCGEGLTITAGAPYCIFCGEFFTIVEPMVEPAPVKIEVSAAIAESSIVIKPRCPHYASINEFFALARENGFDTSKASQDSWSAAIGILLGHRVQSRSQLTGEEWAFAINALRLGRLFI